MAVSTNIAPDVLNANPLIYTTQGAASNIAARSDNFGNLGVNEVFPNLIEIMRNGNLYLATSLNTSDAGIAGVVALPTTTSGRILFNNAAAGSNIFVFPVEVSVSLKSGTTGQGLTVLAGLTSGALATPLTASGSNMVCMNTLDGVTKDATTFTDINKTVVQPTYALLAGGQPAGATSGIGTGWTFDVRGRWCLKPQGNAFDVSVLAPTGASPVFFVSVLYVKIKLDVGTPQ